MQKWIEMENRRRWQLKLLLAPYPGLTKIHMEKESFPVRGIIYFMADCPYLSIHLSIMYTYDTYVHEVEGISTYISSSVILQKPVTTMFGRQIMSDPSPPLHN